MRWNTFAVVTLVQLGAEISALGQIDPHRMAGITAMPDRTISLELAGSVPTPFALYFDLYVLDVSDNATDWTPLTTVLRTNNSTTRFSFCVDSEAPHYASRFYRTFTNQLPPHFQNRAGRTRQARLLYC